MNKKIKNAQPCTFNGISFKSKLEKNVYCLLAEQGFSPLYEEKTFVLWKGFKPKIPYYTKSKKDIFKLNNTKLKDITYTPDFIFYYKQFTVIVEVKGFKNDSFPIKMKMFRKILESYNEDYIIWEVYSLKQLQQLIKILTNEES